MVETVREENLVERVLLRRRQCLPVRSLKTLSSCDEAVVCVKLLSELPSMLKESRRNMLKAESDPNCISKWLSSAMHRTPPSASDKRGAPEANKRHADELPISP